MIEFTNNTFTETETYELIHKITNNIKDKYPHYCQYWLYRKIQKQLMGGVRIEMIASNIFTETDTSIIDLKNIIQKTIERSLDED